MTPLLDKPTLENLLDEATNKYGQNLALMYDRTKVSYTEFRNAVDNLAKGLIHLGLRKGDKVCIWMQDNPYWVYSFFAIAKAGGTIIPVNARYKSHSVRYILEHGEASVLIIDDANENARDYVAMVYEMCPSLKDQKGIFVADENCPDLRHVIVVGQEGHCGMVSVEQVMRMGRSQVSDERLEKRQRQIGPEDLAIIQYTSGTTSTPKGCLITHEIVVRNALSCALRLEVVEARDVFLDAMPPFHVLGICFGLLPSISYGCRRIGVSRFDPLEALECIHNHKCTIHGGMGMMIKAELDHEMFGDYDLTSLRTGIVAGPPAVFQQIHELLPHWKVLNLYGLSEVGGNVTTTRIDDPPEIAWHAQGTPHAGLEVKIMDPKTREFRTDGGMGEICVRGWSVMKGYYRDEAATAEVIDQQRWLHTGDRGWMDENGQLRFDGRIKDTIKVGGENVSPAEVEDFLMRHGKIKHAQVVGVADTKYGEVAAAFVELRVGLVCTEDEIIEYCRTHLAGFKVPRHVRFVKEWPMSATKIQKFKLREQLEKELDL